MEGEPFIFRKYPELVFGFSKRRDGNMRMANSADRSTKEARERFFRLIGAPPENIVTPVLAHGTSVQEVTRKDAGAIIPGVDALMTNALGIYLTVTAADCLPVYLYDPNRKVIALIHAGWRGLASGVIEKSIDAFKKTYGSEAADLVVFIGPAICGNHYEVGNEVAEKFSSHPEALRSTDGKTFLDIKTVVKAELIFAGLSAENIETSIICTYENPDECFSYRRDHPENLEAMVAVLGLKDPSYRGV